MRSEGLLKIDVLMDEQKIKHVIKYLILLSMHEYMKLNETNRRYRVLFGVSFFKKAHKFRIMIQKVLLRDIIFLV